MLIIFDKDNTLIANYENRPANTIAEQHLLPGVAEKCAEMRNEGHTLAVASNQGGVAWGFISYSQAEALMEHAASLIGADAWRMCPHHLKAADKWDLADADRPDYQASLVDDPDDPATYAIPCNCRKPAPGMLISLMAQFGAGTDQTVYVGDMESDKKAAEAAGVWFVWASEFFNQEES